MTATTTTTTTTTKADDELARRRIEEEMKRIQQETKEKRQQAMRALIGDEAQDVEARKQGVGQSIKRWMGKGTSAEKHASSSSTTKPKPPAAGNLDAVVNARKLAYAQSLKENADKGKTCFKEDDDDDDDDDDDGDEINKNPSGAGNNETKKKRFEKPSFGVPSLFGSKRGASKQQNEKPGSKSGQPEDYRSEFASIETEESTMVGKEKHIKITGINHQGRKVTKIKIILPRVRAETVPQHQSKGKAGTTTPANNGAIYYSLADIRKGTVKSKGFDKSRKEEYLSPADFQEVFGMTKEDFAALPKWKRDKLKRQLRLF